MESAQPQGLTALAVLAAASFAVVIFAFLKMSGIIHRRGHRGEGRSPPPASFG